MLKALMIITMICGAEHVVKIPAMEQCMAERTPVEVQGDVASTACVPRTEDMLPSELLSQFMDMFMMMEEQRQWDKHCYKNLWEQGEDYYPPKP